MMSVESCGAKDIHDGITICPREDGAYILVLQRTGLLMQTAIVGLRMHPHSEWHHVSESGITTASQRICKHTAMAVSSAAHDAERRFIREYAPAS